MDALSDLTSHRLLPALVAASVLAGCASAPSEAPAPLPPSGTAYRSLDDGQRLAVARSCRDRAAGRATGRAADQLRAVDAHALRGELDDAFAFIAVQRQPVARVCAQRLPFVTPGLHVAFPAARDDGDGSFSYDTSSDKLLTIRGRVTPAPVDGRVLLRREVGAPTPHSTRIDAQGGFAIAGLHLRKVADNSFTVTIQAPPNATRKIHFSAICLDCLAGGPPPDTS